MLHKDLLIVPNEEGFQKASQLIQSGQLLAFPTETVYGLGANIYNVEAIKAIFIAKGRPLTDPLIVHISKIEQAHELIQLSDLEYQVFNALAVSFWPGPLTIIVKASIGVPSLVTANTGYVGIRIPNHPIALRLLELTNLPIAAPSANRFGHVSPTTALHVIDDLGIKGVYVLNGDDVNTEHLTCQFGIESTVIKINECKQEIQIYRQGAITQNQIQLCLSTLYNVNWDVISINRAVNMHNDDVDINQISSSNSNKIQVVLSDDIAQEAPGQAITHYAPDIPCYIVHSLQFNENNNNNLTMEDVLVLTREELLTNVVIIDYGSLMMSLKDSALAYRNLSVNKNAQEAARCLFDTLRWSELVPNAHKVFISCIIGTQYNPTFINNNNKLHNETILNTNTQEVNTDQLSIFDLTLGLHDRIFRAASGKYIHLYIK